MQNYISSLVRKTILQELETLDRQGKQVGKDISNKDFSDKIACIVRSDTPIFKHSTHREHDDPYDSYSTERMVNFTFTEPSYLWDRRLQKVSD